MFFIRSLALVSALAIFILFYQNCSQPFTSSSTNQFTQQSTSNDSSLPVNNEQDQNPRSDVNNNNDQSNENEKEDDNVTDNGQVPPEDNSPMNDQEKFEEFFANKKVNGQIDQREKLLAFPGAAGFGEAASGGRGGVVYTVNTLADNCTSNDGLVTFREAISSCGDVKPVKRIITFNVSGVFRRTMKEAFLGDSDITVACQTAPGPVVITDTVHFFGKKNLIWRYCIHRGSGSPAYGSSTDRALNFASTSDVIIDHVSISWFQDGGFQAYVNANAKVPNKNITLQYSITASGDGSKKSSIQASSALGAHCLSNHKTLTNVGCSFYFNYSAHYYTRSMALWGSDGSIVGNIVYNFAGNAVSSLSSNGYYPPANSYVLNNLVVDGPMYYKDNQPYRTSSNASRTVQDNNFILRGFPYVDTISEAPKYSVTYNGTPNFNMHEITETSDIRSLAQNQNTQHMRCLGAAKYRDKYDTQWIKDLYIKKGPKLRDLDTPQRDYSVYSTKTHPSNYDSDDDGIADSWEQKVIDLDRNDDLISLDDINESTDSDGDGYLDIEEWMQQEARCI